MTLEDETDNPFVMWVEEQLRENGWKLEDYPLNKYGERVIPLVRGSKESHDA